MDSYEENKNIRNFLTAMEFKDIERIVFFFPYYKIKWKSIWRNHMFINIASNGRVAIQNKMRAEIANSSGFFVGKKIDTDIILYHACIPYYRKQKHKIKERKRKRSSLC